MRFSLKGCAFLLNSSIQLPSQPQGKCELGTKLASEAALKTQAGRSGAGGAPQDQQGSQWLGLRRVSLLALFRTWNFHSKRALATITQDWGVGIPVILDDLHLPSA